MASSKLLSPLKVSSLQRSQIYLHFSYSNDCFTLRSLKTAPCFYREAAAMKQILNVKPSILISLTEFIEKDKLLTHLYFR